MAPTKSNNLSVNIAICAINVCGIISKIKYNVIQDYMKQFDIICMSETKCDLLENNEINGYNVFIMEKMCKKHKYGGIHGVCIFVKKNMTSNCSKITDCLTESVLWLHVKHRSYNFILGAVYLPHEMSEHYNDYIFDHLEDDLINMKVKYSLPIVLIGDFNSRTGSITDFEDVYFMDCEIIEPDPYTPYFDNHDIKHRKNMDTKVNNNGRKLLQLCKMSDIKIVNGRMGRDKHIGQYTCHKINGSSTIDYAVISSELFLNVTDFYIDSLDTCMSDVHCPVCIVMSFNDLTPRNEIKNKTHDQQSNNYKIKTKITTKWNSEKSNDYKHSFDFEKIESLRQNVKSDSITSQIAIDNLYVDVKNVFINPARDTNMYKENKVGNNVMYKKRRYDNCPWFSNECEVHRKKYLSEKNSLKTCCTPRSRESLYAQAKQYKHFISKTKKKHNKKFHKEIRNMRSHDPKEFWRKIKSNSNYQSYDLSSVFPEFVDHFRELNSIVERSAATPLPHELTADVPGTCASLDDPFTIVEIQGAIKRLKNNKSGGADNMINEFFKHCPIDCLYLIVDFFNIVLCTGCVPTEWCLGIICPLYKNKGSVSDPDNYRGITLLSCTSKLFTMCLNKRLSNYVDDTILGQEQAGFRDGFSTLDHIFTLHLIVELYQSVHKRVYCCFVDYRKAFDGISRNLLWQKLIEKHKLSGKMLNVIIDMYSKAKSCIKKDNQISEYFPCNIGVRQGDNLSPILFALFINDFKQHISSTCEGLNVAQSCYPILNTEDVVLMKLFVLLYADDTILLAENEHQLQTSLNSLHDYCLTSKLCVNISKTKIVIYSRGKVRKYPIFKYGDDVIEVVSDYIYLGVKMNYDNRFPKAMRKQLDQGRRAQFSMLIKARKLDLPVDIQCDLFEKLILPVLLYGCEIWGHGQISMLETFYKKFIKKILKLRSSTPNPMIYGEVGKLPLQVYVDKRLMSYWFRILLKDDNTYVHIYYMITLRLFNLNVYSCKWLCRVKCILDNCGLSYMWDNQQYIDNKQCKLLVHQQIEDQALQKWHADMASSTMCKTYKLFKTELVFENYILNLHTKERIALTRFRCANSKLPVYNQIYMYDSNKCTLCNTNLLGDEYHYILICPYFDRCRSSYLSNYFIVNPNVFKFNELLCSRGKKTQSRLAKFIGTILHQF